MQSETKKCWKGKYAVRISIGLKIGGGFFILLVLLAVISFEGILIMNDSSQDLNDVDVRMHRISLDYQTKNAFQSSALAMRGYMTYSDEDKGYS